MTPHIMVFNHDSATLDLFADLLRGEGYQVTLQLFGQTQHNMLVIVTGRPHLLITDHIAHQRPDEWAFIEEIQRHPLTKPIPLLVCTTAGARVQQRIDDGHLHPMAIIAKPFHVDVLLAEVIKLVGAAH